MEIQEQSWDTQPHLIHSSLVCFSHASAFCSLPLNQTRTLCHQIAGWAAKQPGCMCLQTMRRPLEKAQLRQLTAVSLSASFTHSCPSISLLLYQKQQDRVWGAVINISPDEALGQDILAGLGHGCQASIHPSSVTNCRGDTAACGRGCQTCSGPLFSG